MSATATYPATVAAPRYVVTSTWRGHAYTYVAR